MSSCILLSPFPIELKIPRTLSPCRFESDLRHLPLRSSQRFRTRNPSGHKPTRDRLPPPAPWIQRSDGVFIRDRSVFGLDSVIMRPWCLVHPTTGFEVDRESARAPVRCRLSASRPPGHHREHHKIR